MSPTDLLTAVRDAGIHLQVAGDKLRFDAPAGKMTPELRDELVRHKEALLAMLAPVEFVSLKNGPTLPLPAVLLALDLERREFRLALDTDLQILIEPTPTSGPLTDVDVAAVTRWRWHLGALVAYCYEVIG